MTSLENIYSNYKLYCDKGDRSDMGLYGHYYIEKYEQHFSEKRYTAKNVLEIGTMSGASALMWDEYFPNANIFTLDRDLPSDNSRWPEFFPEVNLDFANIIEKSEKITFIHGDAYTNETIEKLKNIKFDIVIDDGYHSLETIKFFIENYFKLLTPNGIGAIEDIGLDGLATLKKVEKIIKKNKFKGRTVKYDFDKDKNKFINRAKNTKPHDKILFFFNNSD